MVRMLFATPLKARCGSVTVCCLNGKFSDWYPYLERIHLTLKFSTHVDIEQANMAKPFSLATYILPSRVRGPTPIFPLWYLRVKDTKPIPHFTTQVYLSLKAA